LVILTSAAAAAAFAGNLSSIGERSNSGGVDSSAFQHPFKSELLLMPAPPGHI